MRVVPLAFEVEHRVDHVFERLGAGDVAVLGDVADEERRNVMALGHEQELGGRLADLANAAGRRLELQREHRLHRVHHQQCRLDPSHLFENPLDAGFGEQVERRIADAQPIAARLDLVFGFFARGVQHGAHIVSEVRRRLQQQRGLADAGLTPQQDQRTGDDATPQDAIKLGDPRGDTVRGGRLDVGVLLGTMRDDAERRIAVLGRAGARLADTFFDKRVEGAAVVTLALPLRLLRAALLAHEYRFVSLLHRPSRKLATEDTENTEKTIP